MNTKRGLAGLVFTVVWLGLLGSDAPATDDADAWSPATNGLQARISLECKNWGIPKDAAAMISTDSGAWVLQKSERGKVYLRATLTGAKPSKPPYDTTWHGTIQTPLLKVDWK